MTAPHNIHGGFTVFVSLLIEAWQTFPLLCVNVFVCLLWPEHRHDHNMWIHLLKIPNACNDHEPKQGDGFLFCSGPFWKWRLPPFQHSSSTYSHTQTQSLPRRFHIQKDSGGESWKAPVSSFPFQLFICRDIQFTALCLILLSKSNITICKLPVP